MPAKPFFSSALLPCQALSLLSPRATGGQRPCPCGHSESNEGDPRPCWRARFPGQERTENVTVATPEPSRASAGEVPHLVWLSMVRASPGRGVWDDTQTACSIGLWTASPSSSSCDERRGQARWGLPTSGSAAEVFGACPPQNQLQVTSQPPACSRRPREFCRGWVGVSPPAP